MAKVHGLINVVNDPTLSIQFIRDVIVHKKSLTDIGFRYNLESSQVRDVYYKCLRQLWIAYPECILLDKEKFFEYRHVTKARKDAEKIDGYLTAALEHIRNPKSVVVSSRSY